MPVFNIRDNKLTTEFLDFARPLRLELKPVSLTKLVENVSEYLGAGRAVPEREISKIDEVERVVGRAEDILGPIPKPEDLRRDLSTLEEEMKKETKEVETITERKDKKPL